MKKILLATLMLSTFNAYAASNSRSKQDLARDPKYMTIGSVEIRDLTNQYPQDSRLTMQLDHLSMVQAAAPKSLPQEIIGKLMPGTPLDKADQTVDKAGVIVDKVINIGQKIWTVVEKGRPISKFNSAKATALPQNAGNWEQLENWQRPTSRVVGISYKNLYGAEVVKFVYRVVVLYGGTVNGTGKYIGYAAVEPMELNVSFLFSFNAVAKVESVYNMGTKQSPVAGMLLNINWTVETIFQKFTNTDTFALDGIGNIRLPTNASLR